MTTYNKELQEQIRKIVEAHPKTYAIVLKSKKHKHLYEYVLSCFKNFPDLNLNKMLYWILNNIYDYPKCKVCGINNISIKAGCHPLRGYFYHTCSVSCSQKDPEYRKRVKQNNIKKYGVDCYQKTAEYKEKTSKKLKSLDKKHWDNALNKRKKTCIEKYGVEFAAQCDNVKNKIIDAHCKRTVDDKNKTKLQIKQTKLERYGNENFSNTEKAKQTFLNHKQCNEIFIKQIIKKREQTCIEKYGVTNTFNKEDVIKKRLMNLRKKFFNEIILNNANVEPLFSIDEYIQNDKNEFKWKCKHCNKIFTQTIHRHQMSLARCYNCFPLNSTTSSYEYILTKFIESFNFNVINSSRKIIHPQELDIYIPEKKLAIEFDGLYWHSDEMGINTKYHLNKTIECEKQGIQLIHIFENEWLYKQDIVKSRLKNLLGIYDKVIYARKCEIKEVDYCNSLKFQNLNHIQGAINAKVNLGLYFEDELISLMTFGKCRFDKKHEWELLRFCNKLGYHVPGGASKLLKYFERNYNPKSLVSYADRRWSQGKVYEKLGFTFSHASAPNYWYWNKNKNIGLESRLKYQKHKLKNLLKIFDPILSEIKNMRNNGYLRIFDCGNLVYEKNYF